MPTQTLTHDILHQVSQRVVGQQAMVERLLIALLTGGHVLLEGVPGLAKTLTVRTLAETVRTSFSRIQFTPDLLPADVIGTQVFDQATATFSVKRGPIFANIVLADEINRATPRAQAALLECMGERQITVDGETRPLLRPFLVLATQNPIEFEGTFPLPEAQLDRFLFRIRLGYLDPDDEERMLVALGGRHPIEQIGAVVNAADAARLAEEVWSVRVDASVRRYIVALIQATRTHPDLTLGASPRGSLALYRASQARAALDNRDFVLPDDVQSIAPIALPHRCIVRPESALRGRSADDIIAQILKDTPLDLGQID